jgi:hypothetical protein
LYALRTAVETYLGDSITHAEVALPFHMTELFHQNLLTAFKELKLKAPRSLLPPAGVVAWQSRDIGKSGDGERDCYSQQTQVVLCVQYDKAALTAIVFEEDGCIPRIRNTLFDTSLGFAQVGREGGLRREALVFALEELVGSSLKGEESIGHLIVLGEVGGDAVLREVLGGVWAKSFEEGGEDLLMRAAEFGAGESVFVAARAVAADCLKCGADKQLDLVIVEIHECCD